MLYAETLAVCHNPVVLGSASNSSTNNILSTPFLRRFLSFKLSWPTDPKAANLTLNVWSLAWSRGAVMAKVAAGVMLVVVDTVRELAVGVTAIHSGGGQGASRNWLSSLSTRW